MEEISLIKKPLRLVDFCSHGNYLGGEPLFDGYFYKNQIVNQLRLAKQQ